MTLYTEYPSAQWVASGTWTPTGDATVLAAVQDADDGSYATPTALAASIATNTWFVTKPTVPSDEALWRQRVVIRTKARNYGGYMLVTLSSDTGGVILSRETYRSDTDNIVENASQWAVAKSASILYGVSVRDRPWSGSIGGPASSTSIYYQVRVETETTSKPSVTVTAAGATVTTTTPTVAVTYSDTDGWAHKVTIAKVFTAAQYGAAGFDPETSTPEWTGYTGGPWTSRECTEELDDGTTYRTYAKVAKTVAGRLVWSDWSYNTAWTVAVLPPDPPGLTLVWNSTTQAVNVTIASAKNLLTANQANLETDTTGWSASTNCAIARSTTQAKYDTASLRLTSSSSGTMTAITPTGTSGVAVQAGRSYVAQAYSRAGSVARNVSVTLRWWDADGVEVGSGTTGSAVANSTSNYNAIPYAVATAPTGATYASVTVQVASTAAGSEVHYFDGILLAQGSAAMSWNPGGATNDYVAAWVQSPIDSSWVAVTLTTNSGYVTVPDYDAWRGYTLTYRARGRTINDGAYVNSGFRTGTVATTSDGTWWLKCDDATLNHGGVRIQGPLKITQTADVGVFRPLQGDTIVVSGRVYGEDGELDILTLNAAEYAWLEPLLTHNGRLLLQNPDGRQKHIKWSGERSVEETFAGGTTRRKITAPYVEVT